MKLIDQDVPADLRPLYDAYVSPAAANGQPQTKVRTRRSAKLAQRPSVRKKRTRSEIYQATADALPFYAGIPQDDPRHAPFVAARLREMLNNQTPPEYWDDASRETLRSLVSYPTSGPRDQAPNYLYPDPDNRPSTPSYGLGQELGDDEGYSGRTIDGMYRDIFWSWEDHLYRLAEPLDMDRLTPILIQAQVDIGATADARPCRAMFAVQMKVDFYLTLPDLTADPSPPLKGSWISYLRFKPPKSTGDAYYHEESRAFLWAPRDRKPLKGAQFIRVRIANRPLFGQFFNNNREIDIGASITLSVKQRKITVQDYSRPIFGKDTTTLLALHPTLEKLEPIDVAPWTNPYFMITGGAFFPAQGENGRVVRIPYLNEEFVDNLPDFHAIGPSVEGFLYISPNIPQPEPAPALAALNNVPTNYQGYFYLYGLASDLGQIKIKTTGPMAGAMLLCTDGTAMNQTLGSRYTPAIDIADSRPIAWAGGAYIQAADGQWYRFESPPDYGGDWHQFNTFRSWNPARKLGDRALISLENIATGRGILWPSGKPAPHDYYLLTWLGDLQTVTLPPLDWTSYHGQL